MNVTEDMINSAVRDANTSQLKTYEKGCKIEILEWLLNHASGGGNWRRIATMKIDELRGDAPDPDPTMCKEFDCPLYINGAAHTAGMQDCTKIA